MPEADGSYSLAGLPPGLYTVVVWHRSAGFFRKQADTRQAAKQTVDFLIPVDPSEKPR
jgi:hypothetical protein